MSQDLSTGTLQARGHPLLRIVSELADLLPAQGPISIFVHHNTLHAFEGLPFETAVERAAGHLHREPYLSEGRYREKRTAGRILDGDIDAVLSDQLGTTATDMIAGAVPRLALWQAVIRHGLPSATGPQLDWLLHETKALFRVRDEQSSSAPPTSAVSERRAVDRLWWACLDAVGEATTRLGRPMSPGPRDRDLIAATYRIDTDSWIHPPLIRFLAGFLDQGLAHWPMPNRAGGLHGCFLDLYQTRLAARCGPWARALPLLVQEDLAARRDGLASLGHSVWALGLDPDQAAAYLGGALLALPGWAGIVRQIEERPDRVPAHEVPTTLVDYLAVRLLFERAALEHVVQQIGFPDSVSDLRAHLLRRLPVLPGPTITERAWVLFHLAERCELDAAVVERWTGADVAEVERELKVLDSARRRRILHEAFERTVRHRLYDALAAHAGDEGPTAPAFQAVFCLDEREESFRRHLEEVEPACETASTAGFFNIAMYHQGATDAHPRPLCPVAVRPTHFVAEVDAEEERLAGRSRRLQRRAAGFLGYNVHVGSRQPLHGAVLMTVLGWLAIVPLVARVIFPWLTSRWRRARDVVTAPQRTRLHVNREPGPPPIGTYKGFTVGEMAEIVRRVLEETGLSGRLSPLVLIVGHGSVSLNNPHESAHDCGACGGGRGGPNARAFAQMANDDRVRALLATEGLLIGHATWFVGGQRNTCNNDVTFYDEDLVPSTHAAALRHAKDAIETTRRREAHERCRRFDAVPPWYPPVAALAHVQRRAADLAQPRPEYGHATNAYCIIGRRARTRGLFLDRRAFLVSYDPTRDETGEILARIMAAAVPVVAGISLEYYFSYVDPTGYGAGTKLPHNVTSLLGVMDGAQSDLRTGLPWQMVEIHEPVRLTIVVESPVDRLRAVLRGNPAIERLVRHRWVWLASLDPASGTVSEWQGGDFVARAPQCALPMVQGDSADWYRGRRGFLPPAAIVTRAAASA